MYGCVVNGRWRMWVVVLDRPLRVRRSGRTFRSYDACGSGIYIWLLRCSDITCRGDRMSLPLMAIGAKGVPFGFGTCRQRNICSNAPWRCMDVRACVYVTT